MSEYNDPLYRKNRKIILGQPDVLCHYCGKENPTSIDHILPISKGGTHEMHNLLPCCISCNSTKWNHIKKRMPYGNPRYINGVK